MKIPTLLGLALLLTAITLGVMISLYQQNLNRENKPQFAPKQIKVLNISDTSVSIVWQTDLKTEGEIVYDTSQNLKHIESDNRDKDEIKQHLIHFVTLRDLKPDTKYFYKIKSESFLFPDQSLDFKTAKTIPDQQDNSLNKPVQGTVLNTNLNPVDEALVFLKIEDASDLATFTSTAGNFIIPVTDLRTKDLSNFYPITQKIPATLQIIRGDLSSNVDITLPLDQILPPLTLGQNINLKDYIASESARVRKLKELQSPEIVNKFDLNGDGKVNSLDLASVIDLYNSKQKDKKADFNQDGAVDQKDIDIISKALTSNF